MARMVLLNSQRERLPHFSLPPLQPASELSLLGSTVTVYSA